MIGLFVLLPGSVVWRFTVTLVVLPTAEMMPQL